MAILIFSILGITPEQIIDKVTGFGVATGQGG
jgi:hypothetical protein